MKLLLTLLTFHGLIWGQSVDLPRLGERIEFPMRDGYLITYGRQPRSPYINKTYAGIQFQLAVDPDEILVYISTKDVNFRTPEGIKMGATAEELAAAGGGPIVHEEGFPPYSRLPSGWCALFPSPPDNCFFPTLPIPEQSQQITGFFMRLPRGA